MEHKNFDYPGVKNSQDGHRYTHLDRIKELFLSGGKYTAKELNAITGGNDARKLISVLRREGYNIVDVTLQRGIKRYWMEF